MNAAAAWLRAHAAAAPAPLLERMLAALPPVSATVAEALAEAALALYAEVLEGTGGREDALPLLAADALLTHAFEAQAELDPAGLTAFAARWGAAGRLAELAAGGRP